MKKKFYIKTNLEDIYNSQQTKEGIVDYNTKIVDEVSSKINETNYEVVDNEDEADLTIEFNIGSNKGLRSYFPSVSVKLEDTEENIYKALSLGCNRAVLNQTQKYDIEYTHALLKTVEDKGLLELNNLTADGIKAFLDRIYNVYYKEEQGESTESIEPSEPSKPMLELPPLPSLPNIPNIEEEESNDKFEIN